MRTFRVVVADDDPTFRSAAVEVLEADDRFAVVGEVATGAGLAELVEETGADVVLLDVRMPGGGPAAAQQLTEREREVLELLAEGLSNAAIAERLVVSVHTVRNHVANLSTKLGAHSKLEALSIAVREGLLPRS